MCLVSICDTCVRYNLNNVCSNFSYLPFSFFFFYRLSYPASNLKFTNLTLLKRYNPLVIPLLTWNTKDSYFEMLSPCFTACFVFTDEFYFLSRFAHTTLHQQCRVVHLHLPFLHYSKFTDFISFRLMRHLFSICLQHQRPLWSSTIASLIFFFWFRRCFGVETYKTRQFHPSVQFMNR